MKRDFHNYRTNVTIPQTRIKSYQEFCNSGQLTSIKQYLLKVLESHPEGLTRKELSNLIKIEQNSLTGPLLEHLLSGELIISGVRKNKRTNRFNQVYKLNAQNK